MSDQARRLLLSLADKAAALTPPVRDSACLYDYVQSRGRHRDSRSKLGRDGMLTPVGSEVVIVDRELWIAGDGSGRIFETRVGSNKRHQRDLVCEPGALMYFGDLPVDPAELAGALPVRGPERGGFTWFEAVYHVWTSQVVRPRLHAAMLRVLAQHVDVAGRGVLLDSEGRSSEAVSTDTEHSGRPRRYQLLLDPETGVLHEYQVTVLDAAGEPAYSNDRSTYSTFRKSGYVKSEQDRL